MDFRDKLREAMKDLNLNQRQIAGMTGSSKAAVSQWVAGINTPTADRQKEIAASIGLDTDYFQKEAEPLNCTRKGLVRKILPEDAAAVLGIGKETVRKGLQQGCFPWGYAIHMDSGKWVYLINADKLEEIEGVKI